MTSGTETYASNQLVAYRAAIWLETLALSVLLWIAIMQVIARVSPV